jgi:hypothetical protein
MWPANLLRTFGIFSALLTLTAVAPYYVDILRGRTKPQRAAYAIFGTVATISFFSQMAAGAKASLWFAAVLVLNTYIVFLLSIKRGIGGFGAKDKVSLLLVAIILVAWYITNSASLAVVLVVSLNTIAKYLVVMKVYKLPYSDLLFTWVVSTFASIFAALSVGKLSWVLLLSPVQNGVTVAIIASVIIVRRRQVKPPKGWDRGKESTVVA